MSSSSPGSLSRRKAIQLTMLASGGLFLTNSNAMPNTEDFDFIAVNDLHYHDADCDEWFSTVFAAMRESAPEAKFILLGGDLADLGKPEQLAAFHALLPKLGMPWYAVPGNHDCTATGDRTSYDALFPGHTNSSFTHGGWQFIGLDTAERDLWHDTTIPPATIEFLEKKLLTVDPATPLIIYTHFPMGENVVLPPQQPGAPTYNFRPLNAPALLEKLKGYNLQAIYSGHFHSYTERHFGNASLTTDKCCSRVQKNHDGTPEKGWFVCQARSGKVTRRFVEIPVGLRV